MRINGLVNSLLTFTFFFVGCTATSVTYFSDRTRVKTYEDGSYEFYDEKRKRNYFRIPIKNTEFFVEGDYEWQSRGLLIDIYSLGLVDSYKLKGADDGDKMLNSNEIEKYKSLMRSTK